MRRTKVTTRLGLAIANYSYPTGVSDLFDSVIRQAKEAEAAGFDSLFLQDHFYQMPFLGGVEEPMLEAYTALAGLATVTETMQLGTLVTGITYRNPTLLAKEITTLDVISHGRAILGVGAGWFRAFRAVGRGVANHGADDRRKAATFSGKHYCTESAIAEPRYRDHIPTMIGGGGEKKTFGLAARYCDHLNVVADFDELPAKLEVVATRCAEVGPDPSTLETSVTVAALLDDNLTADQLPEPIKRRIVLAGTPERIADEIRTRALDVGIDGVIVGSWSHPRQGHRAGPSADGGYWTVTPTSARLDPCSW
jgi:alkanesulfonate monooxygenase SsuD/methylene tetrahydromethanopterin reductase-like flavin-dependent oxidoreductase (luciferase family)